MATLKNYYTPATEGARVRFWGTEFEHPHAGVLRDTLGDLLRESHNDSTIPVVADREDCQCANCGHSCDCERCEISSGWCDYYEHTEVTMKPSCNPAPEQVRHLIQDLADTRLRPADFGDWCSSCRMDGDDCGCGGEDLSDWGFHTHLDARDLTLSQVASATRLLSVFIERFSAELGADGDGYNEPIVEHEIDDIRTGHRVSGRPRVNPNNVIAYFAEWPDPADREDPSERPSSRHKATIEIRGFRYTTDPEFHFARVAFVRACIDYVKSGQPVFWLMREESLEAVCQQLEISRH